MATKHFFIFIHGMTPERKPGGHSASYESFRTKLVSQRPALKELMIPENCIFLEYCHNIQTGQELRDDEKLTRAEEVLIERVNYQEIRRSGDPGSSVITDLSVFAPVRWLLMAPLKESIVIRGLGDVVYYCSEDGEKAVRRAVYGQALTAMEHNAGEDISLHVIAHSLGTTVAHDFLFGLFAPAERWAAKKPDFESDGEFGSLYAKWRRKAQSNPPTLRLGSMCSMASQIPLLLLRRQTVVDLYYDDQRLNPQDIGVPRDGKVKWKIFYDVDDLLAFPTRNIYADSPTIMDIQVDTGNMPDKAHGGYFENPRVIQETAQLIADNL